MKSFPTRHSSPDQLLEQAFDQYYPRLYRYFRLRGAASEEAQDLASAVFERAIHHLPQYDPQKSHIQTWLFAIAHNLAINHWKAEAVRAAARLEDDYPDLENASPEGEIIQAENQELLLQALNQLDSRARQIIALKFGAPLTNRQIGRLMHLSEQNVGVILYRSLLKIRKFLIISEVNHD